MKVYLSLPISSHDLKARETYAYRQCALLHMAHPDYTIINPFVIASKVHKQKMQRTHTLDPPTYEEYMQADLRELATCDMAYFCPDWQTSEGCKTEMALCRDKDIPVRFVPSVVVPRRPLNNPP